MDENTEVVKLLQRQTSLLTQILEAVKGLHYAPDYKTELESIESKLGKISKELEVIAGNTTKDS